MQVAVVKFVVFELVLLLNLIDFDSFRSFLDSFVSFSDLGVAELLEFEAVSEEEFAKYIIAIIPAITKKIIVPQPEPSV